MVQTGAHACGVAVDSHVTHWQGCFCAERGGQSCLCDKCVLLSASWSCVLQSLCERSPALLYHGLLVGVSKGSAVDMVSRRSGEVDIWSYVPSTL